MYGMLSAGVLKNHITQPGNSQISMNSIMLNVKQIY